MKKVLSIALVLMMLVVIAVPTFAAGPTKTELLALAAKAPAEYQPQIIAVINAMTDAQASTVSTSVIVNCAKGLQAKQAAGTLTADDVVAAANTVATYGLHGDIQLSNLSVVDGKTVSVVATVALTGVIPITSEYKIAASGETAPAPSVIKATGMSAATAAIALALAISGVFGFAVIKSRKVVA